MTQPLTPTDSAATILLRRHLGSGYSAGPDFPGDTIRKAIKRLYALGYFADSADGRIVITQSARTWLSENHLRVRA